MGSEREAPRVCKIKVEGKQLNQCIIYCLKYTIIYYKFKTKRGKCVKFHNKTR